MEFGWFEYLAWGCCILFETEQFKLLMSPWYIDLLFKERKLESTQIHPISFSLRLSSVDDVPIHSLL